MAKSDRAFIDILKAPRQVVLDFPGVALTFTNTSYATDGNMVVRQRLFDKSKFGRVKAIYFCVGGIAVSAGYTAYLRLYNITDDVPIPESEVSTDSAARTHLKSGDIKDYLPDTEVILSFERYVTGGTGYACMPGAYLLVEVE